jgi:excisionase family DNA binding protein
MLNPRNELREPNGEQPGVALLTREELAAVLKVSVCTVDRMVAAGEIPHIRLRGTLVRFHLPDVVRALAANALTRKHGPGKERA